jgi:signal peptidase I
VTTAAPAPTRRSGGLRQWIRAIVSAWVIWLLARTFLVQAFHVTSESMEGTFLAGDVLFVARPLYGAEVPFTGVHLPAIREPRRGDIVVFGSVETPGLEVVKRVIGLPGDTLAMEQGRLLRNGRSVEEPYTIHARPGVPDPPAARDQMRGWQEPRLAGTPRVPYRPDRDNWGPLVVPAESLFVMGDNRDLSYDGRFWGFLPRRNLHGSPLVIYYSFDPASWRPLPVLTATRWNRLLTVPH